jgi:hypothetical protein
MASSAVNVIFTFTCTKYFSQNVRSEKLRDLAVDRKYDSNIKTELNIAVGLSCLRMFQYLFF